MKAVVADRGYDSDAFVACVLKHGALPVIPSRKCRKQQREHDVEIYKMRNIVERFFARIKQFRRIATRYDKTSASFLGAFFAANICIIGRDQGKARVAI